jgi:hypothetical protein
MGEYSHISFFEGDATLAWYQCRVYVLVFGNGIKKIWLSGEKQITDGLFSYFDLLLNKSIVQYCFFKNTILTKILIYFLRHFKRCLFLFKFHLIKRNSFPI